MKKNTKVLLGLGIGAAAFWALSKRAEAESGVELALINTRTGERVGFEGDGIAGTLAAPVEGESYQLAITVKNESTRGPEPINIYIDVNAIGAYSNGVDILGDWWSIRTLVPINSSVTLKTTAFTIPMKYAGYTMTFSAKVFGMLDAAGTGFTSAPIASASKTTSQIQMSITYKATVTLNA